MSTEEVRLLANRLAATIATCAEARKRGEIVDYEVTVDAKGNVVLKVVRP